MDDESSHVLLGKWEKHISASLGFLKSHFVTTFARAKRKIVLTASFIKINCTCVGKDEFCRRILVTLPSWQRYRRSVFGRHVSRGFLTIWHRRHVEYILRASLVRRRFHLARQLVRSPRFSKADRDEYADVFEPDRTILFELLARSCRRKTFFFYSAILGRIKIQRATDTSYFFEIDRIRVGSECWLSLSTTGCTFLFVTLYKCDI